MDQLTTESSNGRGVEYDVRASESRGQSANFGVSSSYAPKLVKLDFPRFNGREDPTSWLCRAEQFFQFHDTPEADRVSLASFHLEGDAQLWYQLLKQEERTITWVELKEGLHSRYGPNQFFDHFGELTKLQQCGSVQDYQNQFEKQIGCFVSGLTASIRTEVQAGRPASLSHAISLAKLYEARNSSQGRGSTGRTTPQNTSSTSSPSKISGNSVKRLTWDELNERKKRGLCFKCNERYGPGHKCKKLFSIQAILDYSDDDTDMKIEDAESADNPTISLHAIYDFEGPETMRVQGKLANRRVMVLIDSGSTHNFVSERFVRKVGLQPIKRGGMEVSVASGEKLVSSGKCNQIQLNLQEVPVFLDLYVLPLEGYDVVLGTQWLRTLGPIIWDFSKLLMKFVMKGQEVILQGSTIPENQVISNCQMQGAMRHKKIGYLLQILSSMTKLPGTSLTKLHPQIQQILKEFRAVSMEPSGLPPLRIQDHKIPLQHAEPISVKPYRYPHYQKFEIEKIVAEMLESRIIRPSQSPYLAPVLLVKKHDGSWRMCVDYRALNKIAIKDRFPIPVIDELLDELNGARYFTKLDLRSGYYQIRVHAQDIEKIAFQTHQGHYEFLHHQLFVKIEKCQFGQREVKYLGHVITDVGVAVETDKIKAIQDWPKPTSCKAMRGFLGLCGYYRKFIQNFSKIASSLTRMLKTDSFKWTPIAEEAFIKLKQAMTNAPVLALSDFSKPFIIEYDAFGIGVGAVLMQE
ncbi:hypothetical protein K2173_025619 [Erythroxylum novogranatense]|uniref:Uncharacterized protein n=1 Tax=Erythroxylum novogranatense TaxID=1862640 RepID=A0AAV8SN53_9ROSI|nr:hypothetical protein K2173_025619 [Erythroxylum novogranatense]